MSFNFIQIIKKKWNKLPVAGKLYSVFGVMAFLICFELIVLAFAMSTLSSVRAFVAGEGHWSKAQKDAVTSLQQFIITNEYEYFMQYQKYLDIPRGDRLARLELEKENPDYKIAFTGFLKGKNHHDDIDGMIRLIKRFSWNTYLANAIEAWSAADRHLDELIKLAQLIENKITSKDLNSKEIKEAISSLDTINQRLTYEETRFSNYLGEGSRWLERLIFLTLLLLVLTVELTGLIFTFSFSRSLSKGLKKLKTATEEIGRGNFNQKVIIRSEDELGQLAQSINQMSQQLQENVSLRKEAEEANKTKSLFLANMSHEIRTPLASIVGFADILRTQKMSDEERDRYLKIILNSGETLSNVINDILDISKVESGHLNIEKTNFSLFKVLEDLKNLLSFKANERGVALKFEMDKNLPETIYSDPLRLRQILLNLIGNAIKFTQEGEVRLSVKLLKAKLIFDIIDTGMGIPKKDQSVIFETFRQSDNGLNSKNVGTGLGLPLSQHLAQLLGGDVCLVDSSPQFGSHFRATIDYVKANQEIIPTNSKEKKTNGFNLKGTKILVAEDGKEVQLLLKVIFDQLGCEVDFANDGLMALEKVKKKTYDVLLIDLQMPKLNGYETIKRLRKMGVNQPIIAQTAFAMKEEREKCMAYGFDDILTKPLKRESLITTLSQALSI